jgi:hypothetical protein
MSCPKMLNCPAMVLPGGKAKTQRISSRDAGVARIVKRVPSMVLSCRSAMSAYLWPSG